MDERVYTSAFQRGLMSDKIVEISKKDPIFCENVVNLYEYMTRSSTEPDQLWKQWETERPCKHCCACGHTKPFDDVNDGLWKRCPQCKTSTPGTVPAKGGHDLSCKLCLRIITREAEQHRRRQDTLDQLEKMYAQASQQVVVEIKQEQVS